jgi:putative ABC transport system permease protein
MPGPFDHPFLARVRALLAWRRKESELDEEIHFHLSEEAEERRADGLSEDAARTAARKAFGNPALVREMTRETWGWAPAERLMQDGRSALRMMRRDPGFWLVAILTLALGIAATTALLHVIGVLLLRPLPIADADRVVVLFATSPERGLYRDTTSFHDFVAWRDQSEAFTAVAAYRQDQLNVTGNGGLPEPVRSVRASHELLNVLGVAPVMGRSFDEAEQRGGVPVAVISHALWTRRYGADDRVLGRTIVLHEVTHTIIGVLPEGFQFPPFRPTDVLVPIPVRPCRSCGYLRGIARLRPGATMDQAQRELDAVAWRLAQAFPESNKGRGVNVVSLHEVTVGLVRTPLWVLLGAGVFVLLIGCGNVANLLLARGLARQREFALRAALGAGKGRLVRQLLTEGVVLALIAALLASALALMGGRLLVSSLSERLSLPAVTLDWTLFMYAVVTAVASGLLSGLAPAILARRTDLTGALKRDGRTQAGGALQPRLRNVLVVAQTALTVVLLVGAGLLTKSFLLLQRVDLGLDPRHVLTADLLLSKRYANPAVRDAFMGDVTSALRELPGARHVAFQTDSPFNGGGRRETFNIEGRPDPSPASGHPADCNLVAGDFFRALDIRIVRGRDFGARDAPDGLPVAIVNETMAREFWPNDDAIGRRVRLYYDKDPQRWVTIIGVARDARYRYEAARPQIFLPDRQSPFRTLPNAPAPFASLVLRTTNDPSGLAESVRDRIWSIDRNQPVLNVQSMEQLLWQSVAEPRSYAILLAIFAVVALVIASAGIYGTCAYSVVRRTHEIGIRMAVGATATQILRLLLRQGTALIVLGVALGVAGSLMLGRIISGFLYAIEPADPPTLLLVVILFAVVAFLAIYIPARRATRIDPTVAFRYE